MSLLALDQQLVHLLVHGVTAKYSTVVVGPDLKYLKDTNCDSVALTAS